MKQKSLWKDNDLINLVHLHVNFAALVAPYFLTVDILNIFHK